MYKYCRLIEKEIEVYCYCVGCLIFLGLVSDRVGLGFRFRNF